MNPYVPLRDVALMPGTRISLIFGRPGSVEAVLSSSDSTLLMSTQRDWEQETPECASDVFPIGVRASLTSVKRTGPTQIIGSFRVHDAVVLEPNIRNRIAVVRGLHKRGSGEHNDITRSLVKKLMDTVYSTMDLPNTPGETADRLSAVLLQARPLDQQRILEEVDPYRRLQLLFGMVCPADHAESFSPQ